jgi:hypothetical protein
MPALVNARLPGPNSTALARPGTARLELAGSSPRCRGAELNRHAGEAQCGSWPALARSVRMCTLIMTRDGLRCWPRPRLRQASMKAGHSGVGPHRVRIAGSRLAAHPPPRPEDPAKKTLLCTGRPFRRWRQAAGGQTVDTPRPARTVPCHDHGTTLSGSATRMAPRSA